MHRRAASGASTGSPLPLITACFLIRFDQKIGYTIAWKRSIPDLEIEGAVEYKSLPSGLHNVKEDLVYFTHEKYAGLSAFLQEPATETERNAQFVAVGILVSLGQGRFGRGWLHAAQLKELALTLLGDINHTKPLEDYWEAHCDLEPKDAAVCGGPSGLSESITLTASGHDLSPYHPILSLSALLDEFGPLVFPIYRNALLRQRVLLLKKPPIRICCEYVYILSILSSIPPALADSLLGPLKGRASPLFTICIHDIPMLEKAAAVTRDYDRSSHSLEEENHLAIPAGWIACSSDEVLSTKRALSDMRIKISSPTNVNAAVKQWPSIHDRNDMAVKATQRDVRRYKALREGIGRLKRQAETSDFPENLEDGPQSSLLVYRTEPESLDAEIPSEQAIVEPQSWAAIAYDSYMWWASAGERSADLREEYDQDADLLFTAADVWEDAEAYARRNETAYASQFKFSGALEMAVVAYFHRITTAIMETMQQLVEVADSTPNGEGSSVARVFVSKDDLVSMGLDPWSASDREWVTKMFEIYFAREADVQGASVECCGVKIY